MTHKKKGVPGIEKPVHHAKDFGLDSKDNGEPEKNILSDQKR